MHGCCWQSIGQVGPALELCRVQLLLQLLRQQCAGAAACCCRCWCPGLRLLQPSSTPCARQALLQPLRPLLLVLRLVLLQVGLRLLCWRELLGLHLLQMLQLPCPPALRCCCSCLQEGSAACRRL
jgi:hypothetical protein